MLVMDNQQATAWFVGILEGEGSFGTRHGGSGRIQIHNNDKDIIDKCEEFLKQNQVLFSTYQVKAGKKIGYKLCITMQDCINLFRIVQEQMDCRNQEFQQIVGASETEREPSINVSWLIGIWEAEGSIFLSTNHRENLIPRLELDNTNSKIIKKIVINLRNLGCSWYCKDYDRGHKPFTRITIQGLMRCQRFLRKVKNLWQSRRNEKQSQLLLEFVDSRLQMGIKEPYTQHQKQIYYEMLNG